MERVDEKKLSWRKLIGGEGETARRRNRAASLPGLGPRAHRLKAARDCDLLRLRLSFPRRECGADVDLEARQWFDCECGTSPIAHFLEADHVRIQVDNIRMHGADLLLLLGGVGVRTSAREPLHVPKRGAN